MGENTLSKALAQPDTKLIMDKSYEGVVRHVEKDRVIVVYETEDDMVEHVYERDQFVDSCLPELGDRLMAYSHIVKFPPKGEDFCGDPDELIDLRSHRKNIVKPPYFF